MLKRTYTTNIVITALMMGVIAVSIMFFRIPTPATQGYVHLGDAMIFLAVLVLGWKYGAVAAAFGGGLADILAGYANWAPWTFGIKGIMAMVMGLFIEAALKRNKRLHIGIPILEISGMIVGGTVMVIGYYGAAGVMLGNWVSAAVDIPANIVQFVVGMIIASALAAALSKTPARSHFYYKLGKVKG